MTRRGDKEGGREIPCPQTVVGNPPAVVLRHVLLESHLRPQGHRMVPTIVLPLIPEDVDKPRRIRAGQWVIVLRPEELCRAGQWVIVLRPEELC